MNGHCKLNSYCGCNVHQRHRCPQWQEEPHTELHPSGEQPSWRIIFWKDGVAATRSEATRAEVEVFHPGSGYCRAGEFEFPPQRNELESFERTLMRVYLAGKRARSREFQKILDEGK
jgi:hypothetical protein